MQSRWWCAAAAALALLAGGCAEEMLSEDGCSDSAPPSDTVSCVLSFDPGEGAGFGQSHFPDIVFGEPHGNGDLSGSLDVVSLGRGGSIAVGFGGGRLKDGPGPDFVVFENVFFKGGDPSAPFIELGEVSVSSDGVNWVSFDCHKDQPPGDGCAGWHPVYANPDKGISAKDLQAAGGDPFDLADIGVAEARFVRITDLSGFGDPPLAGFDLDAIVLLH